MLFVLMLSQLVYVKLQRSSIIACKSNKKHVDPMMGSTSPRWDDTELLKNLTQIQSINYNVPL